jgi:hypothetical protein
MVARRLLPAGLAVVVAAGLLAVVPALGGSLSASS